MRTLAITENITVDGSIEMLRDWFDPTSGGDTAMLAPLVPRGPVRAATYLEILRAAPVIGSRLGAIWRTRV